MFDSDDQLTDFLLPHSAGSTFESLYFQHINKGSQSHSCHLPDMVTLNGEATPDARQINNSSITKRKQTTVYEESEIFHFLKQEDDYVTFVYPAWRLAVRSSQHYIPKRSSQHYLTLTTYARCYR
jgi:hypothetical protein